MVMFACKLSWLARARLSKQLLRRTYEPNWYLSMPTAEGGLTHNARIKSSVPFMSPDLTSNLTWWSLIWVCLLSLFCCWFPWTKYLYSAAFFKTELCIGLSPYKISVYTQHMAALDSGKGLGSSAMELGSLMFSMVDTYLVWINQDVGACAHIKNINLPTRLSTPLMEAPRKASFLDIIRATTLMPSGPVVRSTMISSAPLSKNYKTLAAANIPTPTPTTLPSGPSCKLPWKESTSVPRTLVQVSSKFLTKSLPQANPDLLEGIKSSGSFLWRRIQGLGGSALQKGHSLANSDGLGFLLKHIHKMLLGIALVIESRTILSKEAQFQKDQHGSINHTDLKRLKRENLGDCIFCKGPPGVPTKVWTTERGEAYASLAIFAAFAAAGWFSIMKNWKQYLLSDIYGICCD
ncbi:hypothetical protein VP01_142g20 [Puccinia sorghi]|uniref:Uncharacterized protein n=1 Tax=Puccinia sorghi TaxID=27349 RepID=A0A0L6VMA6_9BASI|nr:hypothetical protein VP01_142g20 [Puccinia sorghi]